jgi:hypothetical protein
MIGLPGIKRGVRPQSLLTRESVHSVRKRQYCMEALLTVTDVTLKRGTACYLLPASADELDELIERARGTSV